MNTMLPDIPRIYTALAEWGACVIYLMTMRRRLKGWRFFPASLCALAIQSVFLVATKDISIYFWVPCMMGAVALMFVFIFSCGEIRAIDAGYYCVRAFVLAELAASLEWQLHCFFWPDGKIHGILGLIVLVLVYLAVFVCVWLLEKRHVPKEVKFEVRYSELLSSFLIGATVFGISNLSFISVHTPFSTEYGSGIFIIRTMVDLGGFAILYAYHIQCCELRFRRELQAIQNILQNHYLQYQQSKESIEIINRKYHDLKHQIAVLRAEKDAAKRNAYLDGMEAEIKTYETQNKTGNLVLDTVLTGKSLYCAGHGITLNCVADGKLLDFMDVMDICTVFGNALDNAIECAEKIPENEKRLIYVSVFSQKSFVVVRFENYYEGDLLFEGGLPATTKGDRNFHGYGIKSIKHVAEKYGGTVAIKTEKNWFELRIIIPLK